MVSLIIRLILPTSYEYLLTYCFNHKLLQQIDFKMVSWWTDPSGRHAYILSLISLLITFSAAIGGIVASIQLSSSLMLVYGLENVVDFISSAIVLWRFFLPAATPLQEARLKAREKRASIGISMVLALLGGGTVITASEDFASGPEDLMSNLISLFYVSFFSTIVFGGLALIKFHYARKLSSPSLRKDGVCSAIGGVLAASVFMSTILTSSTNGGLWWLDPLIALICGLGSLVYGLYGIYKAYVIDGHPVCTLRWWIYGDQSTISAPGSANQELEMNIQSSSEGNGVSPSSPEPGNMERDVENRGTRGDVDEMVMT